jgi:protein-disulfide isomerase
LRRASVNSGFCAKFGRDALPEIQSRYVKTGKVLLAFRQFPLTIHPFAQKAAEASECAARQGKFWDMHDLLFEHQQQLTEADLRTYARRVRLDGSAFDECLLGATSAKVRADADAGRQLAVSGTPTFFVGRIQENGQVRVLQRFSGALPPSQFDAILERALKTADAPSAQN